jgi:predicted transcriptional regulator
MEATVKERMLHAIQELPDDSNVIDGMEKLYVLYKIEKGIRQTDAGQKVSHEEAKKRMEKWLN